MKKVALFFTGFILVSSFSISAFAQTSVSAVDTSDRTADHDALRVMLIDAVKAINEGRFDDLTKYFDPNIDVIYQNAEVADGIPAVQAFQKRILSDNGGVLKGFKTTVTADKLTKFYGDTAIAYGTAVDHYTLATGKEMDVTSKWSTTLVKENGVWKVVSLQFTTNLFDNPLLSIAKASNKYFGIGGLVLGLILGFFGVKLLRKNNKKNR